MQSSPIVGLEHVVPFDDNSKQYPSVPSDIVPFSLPTVSEACRKETDLMMGTLKDAIAKRIVASRVTRKPGVAGRRQPINEFLSSKPATMNRNE